MKIGIIGAGEIGGTLARQYTRAGHQVKITNASGIEKLKDLVRETGASAVDLAHAVKDVEVVVISVPYFAVRNLPRDVWRDVPHDTVIVDTCNYYPIVSGVIQEVVDGMHESQWVSQQIGRPVIKAYNSIFYRSLLLSGLPAGHPSRVALPVAGDDQRAKERVVQLINDSGFDAYDYGSLDDSWRQQPGSPVYCTDLTLAQLEQCIMQAKRELLPQRREEGLQYILDWGPAQWKALVRVNRKIYESGVE
jgi:predicted dinucleotide-binding enzyme